MTRNTQEQYKFPEELDLQISLIDLAPDTDFGIRESISKELQKAKAQGIKEGIKQSNSGRLMYQTGVEDGIREERERIKKVISVKEIWKIGASPQTMISSVYYKSLGWDDCLRRLEKVLTPPKKEE